MNIHELDSYDLGDAVKFNDKLNPRIWDDNERMRPEVREQLLRIADDFREFLGIDVEVKDITVSGSNAAYTYTPHSDIDLHLVVDLPRADENAVYRELFDAKKYAYNDMHDIKIGGSDVELYVQDANKTHHSQGIYSIQNDDWVSVPKRRRPNVDDISVRSKFEDLGHRIESAIASGDIDKITDMAEKLRDYRQAGLDAHGEFGAENLAFKILRTQGLIEKLYAARNQAKDDLLSLDERRKKKKRSVKYGYGAYWYPGTAYAGQDHPAGTEGGGDGGGGNGGESLKEVSMSPDGVNPSTTMVVSDITDVPTAKKILSDFVEFAATELALDELPAIKLRRDPQWPVVNRTFGRYNDDARTLEVAWGQRHIMDVLRTVAHELTHKHQHEREAVPDDAGETGSRFENEANARAGMLMRDYAAQHPEYFARGTVDEGMKQKAAAMAAAACLIPGTPGCSSTGQVLRTTQDVGRTAQTISKMTRAGVQDEMSQELRNFIRAQGGDPNAQNQSTLYQYQRRLEQSKKDKMQNEGASGYIPTKKQARDPRFSMALTVDIQPGQIGKEANKLKLKTDSQGRPQTARANGLFETLMAEYALVKEGIQAPVAKDRDQQQYLKFVLGKVRLGRVLNRQEQEFLKNYQLKKQVAEVSDDRLQTYLNQAGQQVDRRQERMAQARERLNKGYEIYHAEDPTFIVHRFEANTPAEARRYYETFIDRYESDRDFDLQLRRATGLEEGVSENKQITWTKPNFDREYDEVEWQLKHGRGRIPQDVLDFYAKYFPTKQAWLKAVRNGRAVEIPVQFGPEIRNNTENKKEWLHALSAQSHDPEGPAKKARVDKLFAQGGPIEMPIILNTGQGLWLIGGKTRLGKARLELGIPATVWIIGGKQAVAEDKMSQINLDQKLARTPPVWQRFVKGLPPQLAQEFVDERPQPNQEDIAYFTPLGLTSHEPVYVKIADLLRHPENQASIARSPDDVIAAINQRWGTKIQSGKKYDSNPSRYQSYANQRGAMASPSVITDGVVLFGVGRFVAAALRGDDRMRVWSMTRKQAVKEDEDLDEVKMSPGALEKFATSDAAKGIRAGFEAELIFRDTQGSSDDIDPEPNYDADERAYSIQQVIEFFENDEYGYGLTDRERNRLEERLDEAYMQWRDDQITSDFRNDAEDLIRDVLLEETPMSERINVYLTDSMQRSDEEADRIIAAGVDAPTFNTSKDQAAYAAENPDYAAYLEAADAAETELDESVEYSVKEQDGYWDEALDDYRDNYSGDDDSFFSDVGLRWMSDVANEYGLDWPVWDLDNQRNEGSRSWEDIGNELAQVIDMPVVVSDNYHSTRRRPGQWILEPDGSLGPDDQSEEAGLEIVSPPLPLLTAIEKLKQVTDWANDPQGGNAYTNSTTGLHMGVSLPRFTSEDADSDAGIDYVKLILFMGDKYVLDQFGRTANNYAASALDKLKLNIQKKKSDPAGVVELLRYGLTELAYRELQKGVGTSKYTSAHIQDGYIEFRSPGGDWLAKSDEEIGILENTMLRFARAMAIAGDPSAERQEYAKKLYKLVTADNPQYADALKLFSEYSAGTINTEQLKKQWADAVLQKEIPTTGQEEYEVFDMNKSRSPEGVIDTFYARNYDDANDQYTKKYVNDPRWTQLDVRLKQPWFDVFDDKGDVVVTMRARDIDTAQDRAKYEYGQRWNDAWRVYRRPDDTPEPEKKLSPRAQVAKRITTKPKTATQYNYDIVDQRTVELRVVDQFRAETPAEAERVYSAWLKSKDLPDDTADYGYRKNAQAADDQRDSVDIQRTLGIRDVDTDVAQNFAPDYSAYERNSDRIDAIRAQGQQPRQNYELVSDEDPDRVIHRMSNATADEVRAWIAQQEAGGMPPGFLRTRIVAESMKSQQDHTALDQAAQKLKFRDWADAQQRGSPYAIKAIQEIVRRTQSDAQPAPARSAIGQAINQAELDALTQQIQIARRLGDDVNEGQVVQMPANTAQARRLARDWVGIYQDADTTNRKQLLAAKQRELIALGWLLVRNPKYGVVVRHTDTGTMIPLDRITENFADGRVKGKSRPGRVKRAGASCKGSVTDLRRRAKNSSGERAKMYHWCANMKSGRKK